MSVVFKTLSLQDALGRGEHINEFVTLHIFGTDFG